MNKSTIITLLLALVSVVGQAKDVVWEQPAIEYGNSNGYQVLNTSTDWSDNDVWKLTGTTDSISLEDLKKIDYTDETAVRKVFNNMEQYATSEAGNHCRLYNLTDSDKKVHVYSDNFHDGDDSYRVKFVQIIDLSKLYGKQDREYVYNIDK